MITVKIELRLRALDNKSILYIKVPEATRGLIVSETMTPLKSLEKSRLFLFFTPYRTLWSPIEKDTQMTLKQAA